MKLLDKINRVYLIMTAILLLVAGIAIFLILKNILQEEMDEKLKLNAKRVELMIEQGERVINMPPVLEIRKAEEVQPEFSKFADTLLFDPVERENEMFREYTSVRNIEGAKYRITVREELLESHDLYYSITGSLILVMIFLLAGLVISNRYFLGKVWAPFFINLKKLQSYSLQDEDTLQLSSSEIEEFKALNETLISFTQKMRSDYIALKRFTENAAHELQTPLAIIQTKLEELIQSATLNEMTAEKVEKLYAASNRLARLHKNLILLAGIENRQYTDVEVIDIGQLIIHQLETFSDMVAQKNIKITWANKQDITVEASLFLTETLIINLLSNAIKHNHENGGIKIDLTRDALTIENTGPILPLDQDEIFNRFTRGENTGSLGLGLSIAKLICEKHPWSLNYDFVKPWHIFRVVW